ncbi:MAG: transposase [bacterium]
MRIAAIVLCLTSRGAFYYIGGADEGKFSGTSVNRSYLSRNGDGLLRRHLYMGAVSTIARNNVYHDYFDSLVGRGKCKKQALAAVMRKIARVVYAVLRDNEPFSIENYGINPILQTPRAI